MNEISYELIRTKRKTCVIQVYPDARVVVRAPKLMPKYKINALVDSKKDWIYNALGSFSKTNKTVQKLSKEQLEKLKNDAIEYIPLRVKYYADLMGLEYNRISIKLLKSRWGSCSSKKNLNFNYLLMLTPSDVIDYIVVHELCHLKQMNHSKLFWQEVENVIPDYKVSEKWLKKNSKTIIDSAF